MELDENNWNTSNFEIFCFSDLSIRGQVQGTYIAPLTLRGSQAKPI